MPDTHDSRSSPDGDPTLTALLVDQQLRWGCGQGLFVESYLDQQPRLRGDDELLLHLILHEVLLRSQRGDAPSLAEYQRRFPHLAEQLAVQFEVEQALAEKTEFNALPDLAKTVPQVTARGLPATPNVPGYEIFGVLGQGAMGIVYQARQQKLGRIVALKMILNLSPGFPGDPPLLGRLRGEAEALAQLQHPDIVQIFELGECDGLPYLALEYVAGGSLASHLAGKPQPGEKAAALVERVARAMHAAHGCGILHRDLKPDNILLTSEGNPKVGDFGLAKRLDGPAQTANGTLLGTPCYMAPEQADRRNEEVGVAADVYALGAILYELLTGRPPFRAATLLETLNQVSNEIPVSPRLRNPAVSRDLETICLKCLEKEPTRRYPSAEALADDLRCFRDHRPILARPVGLLERAGKWARRRPTAVMLLTVSLLAALGLSILTAVTISQWQVAAEARQNEAQERSRRVLSQVERLVSAEPNEVRRLLVLLEEQREIALPQLRQMFDEPGTPRNNHSRMRAALALLLMEPKRVRERDALAQWLAEESDPKELGLVRDALQPHAAELREPLWERFASPSATIPQRLRLLAALAAFAPNDPRWPPGPTLAELILKADDSLLADLLPILQPVCVRAILSLNRVIETAAGPAWNDSPVLSYPEPSGSLRQEIDQADGLLAERFALVQTLPLERFSHLTDGLRASGYRPVRFRPYRVGQSVAVAVVWTRDGRETRAVQGLSAEQLRQENERQIKQGFEPVDVAGWLTPVEPSQQRYAALWVRADSKGPKTQLFVGVTEAGVPTEAWAPLGKTGLIPLSSHILHGVREGRLYSGVWGLPNPYPMHCWTNYWIDEPDYESRLTEDRVQLDVDVRAAPRLTPYEYARDELRSFQDRLKFEPKSHYARQQLGMYNARLGNDRSALDVLDAYLNEERGYWFLFAERAFLHARRGRVELAHQDIQEVHRLLAKKPNTLKPVEALFAIYLGQGVSWPALEELAQTERKNPDVLYNLAVVHAQAAHWLRLRHLAAATLVRPHPLLAAVAVSLPQPSGWREHRDSAVALLEQSVRAGLLRCWEIRTDLRLASLHDHPGYQALVKRFQADREYGAIWHSSILHESVEVHGVAPNAQLARGHQLAREGYRPVAMSVAETAVGRPLVTASVWQRQIVSEEKRETLARQQAGAGLVLLRLGPAEGVWPLLKHSTHPETRSRLTLRLGQAGFDARVLVDRLQVEPDDSIRRALILALGGYTDARLPHSLRRQLVPLFLRWYRDDPDPGIHGAIDWLLRHAWEGPEHRPLDWNLGTELAAIDEELAKKPRPLPDAMGAKRWYQNGQGQNFAIVDGRAPFLMGSSNDVLSRDTDERLHARQIGRRFAVGTKPVTVAQFERFLAAHPEVTHTYDKQYSPTPDCPIICVSWYHAAQYCRWLSEQEGVAEEDMVYPPVAVIQKCREGKTALRMPADYLKRTGYRLLTEAEWEFACRAGTRTRNYFGSSQELLPHYARFANNAPYRAWPVGQKRPNDLGLFDLYGSVFTWCQDRYVKSYPSGVMDSEGKKLEPVRDDPDLTDISADTPRVLRGASAFVTAAKDVRSAYRVYAVPTEDRFGYGLRVARTWP